MQINELFERDIHRSINGVVKADQSDDANVWQELEEYVVTRELDRHLRRFFETYLSALDDPASASGNVGIWVSGFFGSGKSHFIKILSYLLANREVTQNGETQRALEFFRNKIDDAMLLADIERAVTGHTDVLLFNIDSKAGSGEQSRDAILQVLLRVFNEMRGFSPDHPHIARMEQELLEKGVLESFKTHFEEAAGSPWTEERDGYSFYSESLAKAYGAAMGQTIDDAEAWLERLERDFNNWVSVENVTKSIRTYLDAQGPGHRIVFLIDEIGQFIGGNTKLMLNLQTITENLGTVCDGRAWLVVTSQEDIDAVVGQLRASEANDFSKIQGRFRTRLSLSSGNVDEVIQKRLLKKTPAAEELLRTTYEKQADILQHQLSFHNTGRTFRAYKGEDDFLSIYPFAPYQFDLVQSIFENVRKAGATGLHLARGERSLLDAFQSAAKAVGTDETGVLIPLYRFYPSIESFLEGVVKSTIDNAARNTSLEAFDVLVLKTLFLIRYVDEIPGNVDNLVTLFIDEIDANRRGLRDQLEASLQRLEKQTLVSRNGDDFFFLTNEERDISREIKDVDLTPQEEAKLLGQIIFEDVLRLGHKFRFEDNKNDFNINRYCDQHPHGGRAEGELNLLVITPLIDDPTSWTDSKTLLHSGQDNGQVILKLPDEPQLGSELRQYLQTDKFVQRRSDHGQPETTRRILQDRLAENRQRLERLRATLSNLVSNATAYVAGHQPALKASSPQALAHEALHDLVRNTFSKLNYIEHLTPNPQKEIQSLLEDPSTYTMNLGDKETINARALQEVKQHIEVATAQNRKLVLHDLASSQFAKRPFGWPEWETVHLIIRLVKGGFISLVHNQTTLSLDRVWDTIATPSKWRGVEVQPRRTVGSNELKKVRDLARDLFQKMPPDDEDAVHNFLRERLTQWRGDFKGWRDLAQSANYPGAKSATDGEALCEKLLNAPDSVAAIEQVHAHAGELRELQENHQELEHFFNSQKPTWDRLVSALRSFEPNRRELESDATAAQALTRLEQIRAAEAPYGLLQEVEGLVSQVEKVNQAAISKSRERVTAFVDKQIARVTTDLDASGADADTRNQCLHKLQQVRAGAEQQSSIAHLNQLTEAARDEADNAIDLLATRLRQAEPTSSTPSSEEAPPPTYAKPIKRVSAAQHLDGYIETQEQVDRYLEKLRKALEAAIAEGKRVDIR